MKLISRIYEQYRLMPSLQLHQYRVAAVASMIAEHFDQPLERQEIISACLLHDMGNILKFDFNLFVEFLKPEGPDYWRQVQEEVAQKYGWDVNTATLAIVREIGVSQRTYDLIEGVNHRYSADTYSTIDMAQKICKYADYRVIPHGITSLEERWKDLEQRYGDYYKTDDEKSKFITSQEVRQKIEQDIFEHCSIKPDQITEASATATMEALHNFVVT